VRSVCVRPRRPPRSTGATMGQAADLPAFGEIGWLDLLAAARILLLVLVKKARPSRRGACRGAGLPRSESRIVTGPAGPAFLDGVPLRAAASHRQWTAGRRANDRGAGAPSCNYFPAFGRFARARSGKRGIRRRPLRIHRCTPRCGSFSGWQSGSVAGCCLGRFFANSRGRARARAARPKNYRRAAASLAASCCAVRSRIMRAGRPR